MKVLLINPPSPNDSIIIRDFNRSGRTSKERIIWPQTGLAYLAAMLDKNISVEIVDCIAENMKWPEFLKLLKEKNPLYLISHLITSTAKNDLRVFKEAKKINPNVVTITMGPHPTALPEETLKENRDLDFIIMHEPELTFKELINTIEKGENNFTNIKGISFINENNEVQINEKREYIENLDELPIPRHDLMPLDKYIFPFMASNFTFVIPSRGCPYLCTFCRQPIMWDKKFRYRSSKSIIEELKFLKKIGIKEFIFQADTFTINKEVVVEICEKMISENLNFRWSCNSRVDTVDEKTLKLMKKAGCWMIAYGIESGSQEILDRSKKEITLKQIEDTIRLTYDIGIKIYGYFIIGLIGETKETIQKTIDLSKKLPITFAIFHTASPYPKTELYEEAKEKGWLVAENWEDIDQGTTAPLNYPNLSSKEINKGIIKAYRSFYLRPKAIWRILTSLRKIKDIKSLFQAFINQIF